MYLSEKCKAEICKELENTTETFMGQKSYNNRCILIGETSLSLLGGYKNIIICRIVL